jgi:hypothetical protein
MSDDRLPPDPDWDHVPPDLAALDGRPMKVEGRYDLEGEGEEGTVVIVPGLFGDAARREAGEA